MPTAAANGASPAAEACTENSSGSQQQLQQIREKRWASPWMRSPSEEQVRHPRRFKGRRLQKIPKRLVRFQQELQRFNSQKRQQQRLFSAGTAGATAASGTGVSACRSRKKSRHLWATAALADEGQLMREAAQSHQQQQHQHQQHQHQQQYQQQQDQHQQQQQRQQASDLLRVLMNLPQIEIP
ncbi:hypothetical protein Esti_005945 [Eimeria stiedai]